MSEVPRAKFKIRITVSEVEGSEFSEEDSLDIEYPTNPLVLSQIGYSLHNLVQKLMKHIERALPRSN